MKMKELWQDQDELRANQEEFEAWLDSLSKREEQEEQDDAE